MTSEAECQLDVVDLVVAHQSRAGLVPSLRGVSLRVRSSESLCVVGPSGAGKTTFLRGVIGLLPPEAKTTGQVHLPGVGPLNALTNPQVRAYRRRSLGVVWQDSVGSLIPGVAVGTQLMRTYLIRNAIAGKWLRKPAVRREVHALLRRVGFASPESVWSKAPAALSGGMCQRCVIASALSAPELRLLIGDEPTGSLDAVSAAQVIDLLFDLHQERKAAFIMVTHDVRLARRFDWIAVMNDGRIEELRRTTEFFVEPQSECGRALWNASRALGGNTESNRSLRKENAPW